LLTIYVPKVSGLALFLFGCNDNALFYGQFGNYFNRSCLPLSEKGLLEELGSLQHAHFSVHSAQKNVLAFQNGMNCLILFSIKMDITTLDHALSSLEQRRKKSVFSF